MRFLTALGVVSLAHAQKAGTITEEEHPSLDFTECSDEGCTTSTKSVVIDANWRWLESEGENCYTGNLWDDTICPDVATCSAKCALEGADYEATYGITSSSDALNMSFVTEGPYSRNVGARTYLMNTDDTYQMFALKNREFSFDVDVSNLPCGINGAVYFVAMDEDGGKSKYPTNEAGAMYGTGYCDAQCPHDLKFINGEANMLDWTPSEGDANSGTGKYGSCCTEMDIWEGNKMAHAYTGHTCEAPASGQYRCDGTDCGDVSSGDRYQGLCDKDGCDFAPFRLGAETFFGEGSDFSVDTSKPFTVVTQFITENNSDTGDLIEIRRLFVQDGTVIANPSVSINGTTADSITDDFCETELTTFGSPTSFVDKGGLKSMGEAMENGMVLVMSVWDDYYASMLWLDGDYPTDADTADPGVHRGTCSPEVSTPTFVESNYSDASVIYSAIKFGTIGSTFSNNLCASDTTCNVCDACCKDYLSEKEVCDSCVSEECTSTSAKTIA